jgi:hypothetical protein
MSGISWVLAGLCGFAVVGLSPTVNLPLDDQEVPRLRAKLIAIAGFAILVMLATACGGAATGTGAGSTYSTTPEPEGHVEQVPVPNVYGMTYDAAKAKLAADGLTTLIDYGASTEGVVVGMDPASGAFINIGTSVELTLAQPTLRVPDVVGLNRYKAASILEKAGFRATETPNGTTTDDPSTWQNVLKQTPKAGTKAERGSKVILNVAFPTFGVFLKVEGSGFAMVTLDQDGNIRQLTVSLPWQIEDKSSGITVLSAQKQSGDSSSITCSITVDGKVTKHATSNSPYGICTVVSS